MSTDRDPPRLRDDPSACTAALREALRAAQRELPTAHQTQAVVAGVAGALRLKTAPTHTPLAHVGTRSVFTKWLGVVVLGGLSVYGVQRVERGPHGRASAVPSEPPSVLAPAREPEPAPASHVQVTTPTAPAPAAVPEITPLSLPVGTTADAPARAREPVAANAPRAPLGIAKAPAEPHGGTRPGSATPAAQRRDSAASTVARADSQRVASRTEHEGRAQADDELALIRAAQAALGRQPARALTLLQRHALLLPDGAFAEERDVLMLDALQALGRGADLRREAAAFLVAHPRSMHAARVRAMLMGQAAPASAAPR